MLAALMAFSVAAGPGQTVLNRIFLQAPMPISWYFSYSDLERYSLPAVECDCSIEQVLEYVLKDTDLAWIRAGGNSYNIVPRENCALLDCSPL